VHDLDRLFDWLNRQAVTSISGLNTSRPLTLRRLNGQRRFNSANQVRAASDPSPTDRIRVRFIPSGLDDFLRRHGNKFVDI
jgi:hypothetical protein